MVNDFTDKKKFKKIDKKLKNLEFQYQFTKKRSSIIDFLYKIAQSLTGMFVSHFICYKHELLAGVFSKVFDVNNFLSKLIAPENIVWASVINSAKTIYGAELLDLVSILNQ